MARKVMPILGATLLVLSLPIRAPAMELVKDAIGCVGGPSAGGAYILNATVGLPIVGRSFYWYTEHEAGFWFRPAHLPTTAISEGDSPAVGGDASPMLPSFTSIGENVPNPFNPATTFKFQLAGAASEPIPVQLVIFDATGRRVTALVDEPFPPGFYEVTWNGRDDHGGTVASGAYYARFTAGNYSRTIRLISIK